MAEKVSDAIGKKVEYVNAAPGEMRGMYIKFGMPEWQADGLKEDFAHYRRKEAAKITDGAEKATGKRPFDFDEFARDYKDFFLGE